MSQVLVGTFDSFEAAQQAAVRLEQEGIPRSDVEVQGNDYATATANPANLGDTPESQTLSGHAVVNDGDGAGVVSRIEHFFSNLFGGDDHPAEVAHYREAVRRGGALLSVTVADEAQVATVRSALREAGAVDIDERVAHWTNSGYSGYDASAPAYSADEAAADRQAFSVVRESLEVGKREVETGGVRVYSRVTETPVSESVTLREQHATIERRPVDRPATAADLKDGSVEIRETAERPVVSKTAHVVEEVVVGREATERTDTVNETLRGTEVEVERVAGEKGSLQSGTPGSAASDGTVDTDPLKPV